MAWSQAQANRTTSSLEPSDATFSVSQLNEMVQAVLHDRFPQQIWIRGEIQDYDRRKDRTFVPFNLIEKAADSDDVIASVAVIMYPQERQAIEAILRESQNAFQLQDGVEVRFQASVDLWVKAGRYQLRIKGIDPTFTLGRLAQNRAKIIEALKTRGLLDRNKRLVLPLVPLRIGVIGSSGSAGLNDFVTHLQESGFSFSLAIVHAAMQGSKVEEEVTLAINGLNAIKDLDAIFIVRGGGADADLSWFDRMKLGEAIASSRLPVLTGLGHTHNTSVADLVAHADLKTPTDAAQFLINRVQEFLSFLSESRGRIVRAATELVESQRYRISETASRLSQGARYCVVTQESWIAGARTRTVQLVKNVVNRDQRFLQDCGRRLSSERLMRWFHEHVQAIDRFRRSYSFIRVSRVLVRERVGISQTGDGLIRRSAQLVKERIVSLDSIQQRLKDLDPINTLQRGFSLTYDEAGNVLTSVSKVTDGTMIHTQMNDGRIKSRVIGKRAGEVENG